MVAPQGKFVVQGQEGDVGQGQHGAIGLLRRLFVFPQPWAVVVVKRDLHAGSPALGQLLEQGCPVGGGENGEADPAQIEVVKPAQLLADLVGLGSLQPVTSRGIAAPVVEGALTLFIGFDEIEARQLVAEALYQIGVHPFLLPLGHHGATDGIGTHGGHIVHGQLGVGTGQVNGGVEGVPSKMAHEIRLAFG
ncbi:hypothetical protein D3C75_593770 [compost metagenome]